ncbi:MAG: 30S ribosomal protein S27ae [Euryarchaeota archaeon]|nr:30S ribosomal protein S27ae [Euryarchaeota archaeon]
MSVKDYYKVAGPKLEKLRSPCPRCGAGVHLAEHGNRQSCGKCGYTKFKK